MYNDYINSARYCKDFLLVCCDTCTTCLPKNMCTETALHVCTDGYQRITDHVTITTFNVGYLGTGKYSIGGGGDSVPVCVTIMGHK